MVVVHRLRMLFLMKGNWAFEKKLRMRVLRYRNIGKFERGAVGFTELYHGSDRYVVDEV
jgi:hypothetical protein